MTTQDEHLDRIVARCNALLALAEKRTPGTWNTGWAGGKSGPTCPTVGTAFCGGKSHPVELVGYGTETIALVPDQDKKPWKELRGGSHEANAAFIAAAAGPFEASLRSTITAIEYARSGAMLDLRLIAAICAAWPEETL